MRKCYFWERWWHRRLRKYDLKFVLSAIHKKCKGDLWRITEAWQLHKSLPGQGHWRCQCSKRGASSNG